jgi:hypothetical protein
MPDELKFVRRSLRYFDPHYRQKTEYQAAVCQYIFTVGMFMVWRSNINYGSNRLDSTNIVLIGLELVELGQAVRTE